MDRVQALDAKSCYTWPSPIETHVSSPASTENKIGVVSQYQM